MHLVLSLLITALLLGVAPGFADAQTFAIYEKFTGASISPTKWRGGETTSSPAIVSTDSARAIVSDQLRLALTTYSASGSGTGLAGEGRNRLLLNHPALVDGAPPITAMRVNVSVDQATSQNCEGSSVPTTVLAGMFAFFFNDGSGSTLPNDFTGDVLTMLDVRQSGQSSGVPARTINAMVARCGNVSCSGANILGTAVFARTWALGEKVTLTVKWQAAQNRFVFSAVSAAGSETRTITYAIGDSNPAKAFVKELRVNNALPHCAARAVKGSIDARFDNVSIDSAAVAALSP